MMFHPAPRAKRLRAAPAASGRFRYLFLPAALLCAGRVSAADAASGDTITVARLEDDGRTLLVSIGTTITRHTAPKGKFWEYLVLSGDKKRAFAVLQRGNHKDGWFHEAIHEFSVADYAAAPGTYKLRPIPLVSELDEASVDEIFESSQDGLRLLLSVHYCYERKGAEKNYRIRPYFFDTRTGKITLVAP